MLTELFHAVREENHPGARPLAQGHGPRFVVQYPPHAPSTQDEVDSYYDLPFRRESRPDHQGRRDPGARARALEHQHAPRLHGGLLLLLEHAAPATLRAMNKPSFEVYEAYEQDYKEQCASEGRDQHLINYFIVGHPGTGLTEAVQLFEMLLERNYSPEQVQEFLPLPMTCACVQYVTGRDPLTGEELYIPRGGRERRLQKALVRWKDPDNRKLVLEALEKAERKDLVPVFLRALKPSQGRRSFARSAARPEDIDLDTCG